MIFPSTNTDSEVGHATIGLKCKDYRFLYETTKVRRRGQYWELKELKEKIIYFPVVSYDNLLCNEIPENAVSYTHLTVI